MAADSHAARARLEESERKFAVLCDHVADGVLLIDAASGRIVFANPPICRLLDYAAADLRALAVDALAVSQPVAEAVARLAGGAAAPAEMSLRRRDGTAVSVEVSAAPLPHAGRPCLLAVCRDLSERHQVEAALQHQEALVREAGELAHVGGWEFDPRTGEGSWTEETARIYGVDPGTQPTLAIGLDAFEGESRARLAAAARAAAVHGTTYDLELVLVTPAGTRKWVRAIGRPVVRDGRVVRVRGSIQDITARRRVEEALRRSEANLTRAQAVAHVGSWHLDVPNQVLTWSDETYRIFGIPLGTPLDYATFLAHVHPDDRDRVDCAWRAAYKGAPYDIEHRIVVGDAVKWVRERAELGRDAAGEPLDGIGTAQDVTERKRVEQVLRESEERFAAVFRHSPVGIGIVEPDDGRVVDVNDAMLQMVGYAREEVVGHTTRELSLWVDPTERSRRIAALRRHGVAAFETRFRHKSGSVCHLLASTELIEVGGRSLMLAMATDITALTRAQEEVRTLNAALEQRVRERTAELEAANRERLEAFAYSVSHDLRAPLRAIDGFSQVLLEDCADRLGDEGRDALGRVRAAAQHMARLIDDLLQLSRVARAELRRDTVDLSALARAVAADLQRSQPDRRVRFVIADGLETRGDAPLLRLVLENLLGNAWKFTSRQPRARIEFGAVADPAGRPHFFVRDNGPGFDMADAGKLFHPFQRLHTLAEFPGTGVGLASVRRIIERHGGRVWADSTLGQGATIWFTL